MKKAEFVMYGAEFSLYSGKLRSYLYRKGIAFEERRPWALTYKRFIIPRTGVAYIPVLHTPEDEVWQDSSVIIDHLESRYPHPAMIPSTPRRKLAALILELFADEWLLIPAMHYRWNVPSAQLADLYVDFGKMLLPWGPRFLHRKLGKNVGTRFQKFVPRLGITDQTIPALESWYEALLADLERHFSSHSYLLGAYPTLADFGFIGPFYAHLYRDPRPGKLMKEVAPLVANWVERMMAPAQDSPASEDPLVSADQVPSTLLPVLRRFAAEQLPVLRDTASLVDRWAKGGDSTQDGSRVLPRSIGKHQVKIAGVSCERSVIPYSLWMFQRVLDYRTSLGGEAESFLREIDLDLSTWQQESRLCRIKNQVCLADD